MWLDDSVGFVKLVGAIVVERPCHICRLEAVALSGQILVPMRSSFDLGIPLLLKMVYVEGSF